MLSKFRAARASYNENDYWNLSEVLLEKIERSIIFKKQNEAQRMPIAY